MNKKNINKEQKKTTKILVKRSNTKSKYHNIYIYATFNNTILTVTCPDNKVITWTSSGNLGYKGANRSSNYVFQNLGLILGKKLIKLGIEKVKINLLTLNKSRYSSFKGLQNSGLKIEKIVEILNLPHNGCRPPKIRRI